MRRFLTILLLGFAAVALVALLSPYWLGALAPAVARRFGTTFDSYSRIGYSRFAVTNVEVRRRNVTVKVSRLEAETPVLLLARSLLGGPREASAGDWSVEVVRSSRAHEPEEKEDFGWVRLRALLLKIGRQLERWVGNATIGAGTVHWPNGGLTVGRAVLHGHHFRAENVRWKFLAADVDADFDHPHATLTATASLRDVPISLKATARDERISGTLTVFQQPGEVEVRFEPTGWKPLQASLTAKDWTLSGAAVRLPQFASLQGSADISWKQNRFEISAAARSTPADAARKVPPLEVNIQGGGDVEHYAIERFDVSIPGAQAHLDQPFSASFHGGGAEVPARFSLAVDLASLPWVTAAGQLEGSITATPQPHAPPLLVFAASGRDLATGDFKLSELSLQGRFDWPHLQVDVSRLASGPGSHLSGTARLDLHEHAVTEARAEGRVSEDLVRRWLPAGLAFAGGEFVVVGNGPFNRVAHEGTVTVSNVTYGKAAFSSARVWWKGEGATVVQSEFGIQGGTTEVVASAALAPGSIELEKLVWRQHGEVRLSLAQPAHLSWGRKIAVDGFNLVGPAGEFHARGAWGEVGELHFSARDIAAEWWRDFTPNIPFGWTVRNLTLNAAWSGGPAAVDTSADLIIAAEGRPEVDLRLSARTDQSTVIVEQFTAGEEGRESAHFAGQLPLEINLGPGARVKIDREAPIKFSGQVNPGAREWTELAQRSGLTLEAPQLTLQLDGTLANPRGLLALSAARLQLDEKLQKGRRWPSIEHLQAELRANGAELRLQQTSARIEGQPIALGAVLKLRPDTWKRLRTDPLDLLQHELEVTLQASNVDLTELGPLLSDKLLPTGRLDADVTLSDRGSKGFIRVREVGTRPLGSLGPVRDIHGEIELVGREVRVNNLSASLGGQAIEAHGRATLPSKGPPSFDLNIFGEDLPFVRQAGLLVRGNVRLNVATAEKGYPATVVSGEVQLRDGIFFSDIRALIPRGGGTSPERRPPYFSVDVAPFNRWMLDVNVHGERFLRARTPLFNGVISTKIHLLGTLGEPRSLGEVRIDEGQVLFPFARFNLQDATVRLTEENPYDPKLGIFGTSRRYGYDLRVEVTGSAASPNVVFSSNPPLSSEQVLLLVMAGETPQKEVNYSTSQRFARLGTFFGQSLLGSLSGGEGGDRLTVTSGERVSRGGRETYDVEYELGNRWTLIGEYDEFDEYNAGLKYRILPKEKAGAK